ncbi:MAG: amino acid ABC transporter permease [Ruminococcus flavefaciens]|nr:amino acid ABC transporter permease [Ruminococcus flavefaciens]
MDWELMIRYLPLYLKSAVVTVELTVASLLLGFVGGLLLVVLRMGKVKIFQVAASAYISIIRGTPLLLQIMLIFYALPFFGMNLPAMPSGILALSMNLAAYMAETLRGGIQAVPEAQIGAAYLDGCTRLQCLRYITLPQAFYIILPQLGNMSIAMIKDTSMVSVITITELLRTAQIVYAVRFKPVEAYLTAAVLYYFLSAVVSRIFRTIEKKWEML